MGGLLDFIGHIGLSVNRLPPDPHSIGTGKVFPNLVRPWETVCAQHCVRRKEEESGVRDRVARLVRLLMGVFQLVNLCRYALHFLMVRLYLILEIYNVRGMEAYTHGLEV